MYKLIHKFYSQDGAGGGSSEGAPGAPQPSPSPAAPSSPGPSSGGSGGGDGGAAGSPQEPTPKAWSDPAPYSQARQVVQNAWNQPIPDPDMPKEYSPEAMSNYQRALAQANDARSFRAGVEDVLSKVTTISDGVAIAFTTQEEANGYLKYVTDLSQGRVKLTPSDLAFLYQRDKIIAMARDQGARSHHAEIQKFRQRSTVTPGGSAPGGRTVVPSKTTESQNSGGIPKVQDILKERNPELFNDFMSGKVRFG